MSRHASQAPATPPDATPHSGAGGGAAPGCGQAEAAGGAPWRRPGRWPALAGMVLIRAYQLTLSGLLGRQCRHMPSCSAYTMESIGRFGLWGGGWMGLARICRCHPWGTHGLDFPPRSEPEGARWAVYAPWRYGRWRGVQADPDGPRPTIRCD